MKPLGAFIAAGRAVNHASILAARASTPESLLPQLEKLGEQLARALAGGLAPMCGGAEPLIRVIEPEKIMEGALATRIGALAANALLSHDRAGDRTIISIDARAVMAQLDRAFGGAGALPEELPRNFPGSADILAKRLEIIVAEAFGASLGFAAGEMPRISARDPNYRLLAPFPAGSELALLSLEICEADCEPWRLLLATCLDSLPRLVGGKGAGRSSSSRAAASPLDEPFAGMELPLDARLVDMPIKLSRLSGLAPGMTIPIALDRQVPLRIGGTIVARGSVGEQDDRLAIQITKTLLSDQGTA